MKPGAAFAPRLPAIARLLDLRDEDGRATLLGFAAVLMLVITGHTVLEAARDALLLAGPGPRALGLVYMVIAVCAWPAAALAARASERFGARRSLGGTLVVAALLPAGLFFVRMTPASAMAVYVVSGLIGSITVPQFWTFAGKILTAAQGRRLFGLIAAAGVLGGVLGSGTAAAVLVVLPVKALMLVSTALFLAAAGALLRVDGRERIDRPGPRSSRTVGDSAEAIRGQPLLWRIALSVFVSTATLLVLDYSFKATVARSLPGPEIGPFIARYYLALNGLSLVVQLVASTAVVRQLGVTAAILLTPFLLLLGATGAFLSGGAMGAVLVMKAIDGSLRFSIHRITAELIYLPVPLRVRQRAKPFIDGALARASQTVTGAALLALHGSWVLGPGPVAGVVAVLAGLWLAVAIAMRRPYLALLRGAISAGSLRVPDSPEPLDLESAQLLVRHLASESPSEVVGAMSALSRHGSVGLLPALVLLHSDETVLTQALEHFGGSSRTDWMPLARRLLSDHRESVRMAAARALAMHGALDVEQIAGDVGYRVRGYAAIDLALRDRVEDVVEDERVGALLRAGPDSGRAARLGMLAAIVDAPPSASLPRLLLALDASTDGSAEAIDLVARAAARQRDPRLIPRLVERLAAREGREAVRAALISFDGEGLDAVWWALQDTTRPRSFRIHVPKTLGRFGNRLAAERLLENVETEEDGQVRYKSIRALEQLVTQHRISLDRMRVERLVHEALMHHFRLLGQRVALGDAPGDGAPTAADRLLRGLLDDKLGQSLERAFRLLAIAHPREDFHRLRVAALSKDPYTRANAGELLDALLRHSDQQSLRALLRLIAEDLAPGERAARAAPLVSRPVPAGRDEALSVLLRDHDPIVTGLAAACAGTSRSLPDGAALRAAGAHA